MPIFTPYYWSLRTDTLSNGSIISLRNYGSYVSGDYLEYISYYSGRYLTITGRDAPTSYYFSTASQKNNIRINTQKKSKILFDSNISGDTLTLFSDDVGIYDVIMVGYRAMIGYKSNNIDVSLTLNNINLTGDIGNNRLIGNAFNNIIDGKCGVDVLIGGAGDDMYYVYSNDDTIIENAGGGTDTIKIVGKFNSYTMQDNVENAQVGYVGKIIGNSLNNIIHAPTSSCTIDGGMGSDILIGYTLYSNVYVVDNVNDIIIEASYNNRSAYWTPYGIPYGTPYGSLVGAPSEGVDRGSIDTVESSISWSLNGYLENLTLTGSSNINANGNSKNNTIIGNSGNNILNGKEGADIMIGGFGDDTYYVDNTKDQVKEFANGGTDTVVSDISFYANSSPYYEIENLTLNGSSDINATGNYRSNTIIGNSGDNILNGSFGFKYDSYFYNYVGAPVSFKNGVYLYADTLIGGKGNDSYIVEYDGDVVIELSNEGNDTIYSRSGYELPDNVENLILIGYSVNSNANYRVIGNNLNNILTGNGESNDIQGKNGNDIITGFGGCDTVNGGSGADTFIFNNSDAVIQHMRGTAYKVGNKYYITPEFDTITGLEIGTDIIDGYGDNIKTPTNIGELILPNNSFDLYNICDVLNTKFVQNESILFTYNQRTFLGIDDGKQGFDNTKDSVIEITGYSGNLSNLRVI